jgi:hypothetical protein
MLPRPKHDRARNCCQAIAALLLACIFIVPTAVADPPSISEDHLFRPVDFNTYDMVQANAEDGGLLPGQPYQDFTVQPPQRTFPDCRLPLLSWRVGPDPSCATYGPNFTPILPAHAVRMAEWYAAGDLVALRKDSHISRTFAQISSAGVVLPGTAGAPTLTTANMDYPLDAGGQFMLGRKLSDQLSFETTYLGSFEWSSDAAVRNNTANTAIGGTTTGALASPFTRFGLLGQQAGLDFNNLVSIRNSDHLENLDMLFRYRPVMPYGAYDVSFLYGLKYIHTGENLHYHSESFEPAPGGSVNDLYTNVGNDLIGFQLGLTSHILVLPSYWIDWDVKGGVFNNHARQRTVYQNLDSTGALTSFANDGRRDDTSLGLDVRLIGNYQLLPRLTLRAGYQATFLTSMATAVSNFQPDLDIVKFGPGFIDTRDTLIYHGPVLGVMYER